MLVFFVRHGETVDNVAGVYAGVKDSELTNHGVLQAQQLGAHLKANRPPVSAIFASPLQRARKTAQAILDAQGGPEKESNPLPQQEPEVILIQVADLIEQDFGFYEGKPFYARSPDSPKSGKSNHYDKHKQDPGFKDVESGMSMDKRCDMFLDEHLLPTIHNTPANGGSSIVVVSHGILLSHLWRRFLLRLPRKSITIAPEVTAAKGQIILEHLGGWRNTGYLEVRLFKSPDPAAQPPNSTEGSVVKGTASDTNGAARATTPEATGPPEIHGGEQELRPSLPSPVDLPSATTSSPDSKIADKRLTGYTITIITVNGQDHLRGVKRARGGIGSARHDEGQRKLDKFFKKADKS